VDSISIADRIKGENLTQFCRLFFSVSTYSHHKWESVLYSFQVALLLSADKHIDWKPTCLQAFDLLKRMNPWKHQIRSHEICFLSSSKQLGSRKCDSVSDII
jgi:hypothetical protein